MYFTTLPGLTEEELIKRFLEKTKLPPVKYRQLIKYKLAQELTGCTFKQLTSQCSYIVPADKPALFHPQQIIDIARRKNVARINRACREIAELRQYLQDSMKSLGLASDD